MCLVNLVHVYLDVQSTRVLTFVFLVRVEVEDALDEMLVEHSRMSLLEQVHQTELTWGAIKITNLIYN